MTSAAIIIDGTLDLCNLRTDSEVKEGIQGVSPRDIEYIPIDILMSNDSYKISLDLTDKYIEEFAPYADAIVYDDIATLTEIIRHDRYAAIHLVNVIRICVLQERTGLLAYVMDHYCLQRTRDLVCMLMVQEKKFAMMKKMHEYISSNICIIESPNSIEFNTKTSNDEPPDIQQSDDEQPDKQQSDIQQTLDSSNNKISLHRRLLEHATNNNFRQFLSVLRGMTIDEIYDALYSKVSTIIYNREGRVHENYLPHCTSVQFYLGLWAPLLVIKDYVTLMPKDIPLTSFVRGIIVGAIACHRYDVIKFLVTHRLFSDDPDYIEPSLFPLFSAQDAGLFIDAFHKNVSDWKMNQLMTILLSRIYTVDGLYTILRKVLELGINLGTQTHIISYQKFPGDVARRMSMYNFTVNKLDNINLETWALSECCTGYHTFQNVPFNYGIIGCHIPTDIIVHMHQNVMTTAELSECLYKK